MPRRCEEDCLLRPSVGIPKAEDLSLPSSNQHIDQAAVARSLYQQIKPWQTRVLILKDGELGADIYADLAVVDLIHAEGAVLHERQEHISYTAVSYTWGDTSATEPGADGAKLPPKTTTAINFSQRLYVNGHVYSITANLYCFLQRCRQRMTTPYLWIDALCINQHDNQEKSIQVAGMITIYKKANDVVIWLGEGGPHTDLALSYLRQRRTGVECSKECKHRKPQLVEGLRDLYSRPWITRIWIRQEVWAARTLTVTCGSRQISWRLFKDGSKLVTEGGKDLGRQENPHVDTIPVLQSLLRRKRDELIEAEDDEPVAPRIGDRNDDNDMVTLLNRTLFCRMTDERDRIYAQLSMTMIKPRGEIRSSLEQNALDLRIDYRRPLELVFQDLARYIMKREQSVSSILCLSGTFGGRLKDATLPSWAIDWRKKTSFQPYLYFEKQLRGRKRSARSDDSDSDSNLAFHDSDSDGEALNDDSSDSEIYTDDDSDSETDSDDEDSGSDDDDDDEDDDEPGSDSSTDEESTDSHTASLESGICSRNSKVTSTSYTGPIEDESYVLEIRGCSLATLTDDLPANLETTQMELRYKSKEDKSPQFRKDSSFAKHLQKELDTYSEKRLEMLQADIKSHGKCELQLKWNKSSRKVSLRSSDVKNVPFTRQIVSVSKSGHFKGWQQRREWGAIKYMGARPFDDIAVSEAETQKSRLFRQYAMMQKKQEAAEAKKARKVERAKKAKELKKLKTPQKSKARKSGDHAGRSSDVKVKGSNSSEEALSDSDDSDDTEVSELTDDGSSLPDDFGDVWAHSDDNVSGLSDSDEDRGDYFEHYTVKMLNSIYNEHFPAEFAVPEKARTGDHIVVVEGSSLPLILRSSDNAEDRKYTFVGIALLNNQLYIPSTMPKKGRREKYDLRIYHRLQLSAYEHFQLLLRKRLREGITETFNII